MLPKTAKLEPYYPHAIQAVNTLDIYRLFARKLILAVALPAAFAAQAASNVEQLETQKFCNNVAAIGADAYDRKRAHEDPPNIDKWNERPIIKWALKYGSTRADSRDDAYDMSRAYCLDQVKMKK